MMNKNKVKDSSTGRDGYAITGLDGEEVGIFFSSERAAYNLQAGIDWMRLKGLPSGGASASPDQSRPRTMDSGKAKKKIREPSRGKRSGRRVKVGRAHQVEKLKDLQEVPTRKWDPSPEETSKAEVTLEKRRMWRAQLSSESSPEKDAQQEFLDIAMQVVPVEPGSLVFLRPCGNEKTDHPELGCIQWGRVSAEGPEGFVVVEGTKVARDCVLVPGAREHVVNALSEASGDFGAALESVRQFPAAALWSSEQVNALCALSLKFERQRRDDPLGDCAGDATEFGVEGKKFNDVVDAWHRFKPASSTNASSAWVSDGTGSGLPFSERQQMAWRGAPRPACDTGRTRSLKKGSDRACQAMKTPSDTPLALQEALKMVAAANIYSMDSDYVNIRQGQL
eukprot:g15393.t2